MNKLFETLLQNRRKLKQLLNETPKNQLFEVPPNFKNNMWWNIAHVVVTQQLLIYKMGGQSMHIPDAWVAKYRKGTAPTEIPTEEELSQVSEALIATINQTISDYNAGLLAAYAPYETSFGVGLDSVEDALTFNLLHEGVHFGTVLALQKVVAAL